jgi:hypothetical protein
VEKVQVPQPSLVTNPTKELAPKELLMARDFPHLMEKMVNIHMASKRRKTK